MIAQRLRLLIAELSGVFKMNPFYDKSRFLVHSIVECIKQYDFCFEISELEDSLDEILSYFGINVSLSLEERRLLIAELTGFAWNFEVGEAVWWAYRRDYLLPT